MLNVKYIYGIIGRFFEVNQSAFLLFCDYALDRLFNLIHMLFLFVFRFSIHGCE